MLCGQALAAAGIRRRPEIVFAVSALALQTWPVAYTLHLGEVNLILAALIGADLLRRRDGAWWQGIGTGLAAGIKLTPLIFVAYLALTGGLRAAAVAAGTFAVTVAAGFGGLPGPSRTFWLGGVFYDQNRIGDPANPSDQSLSGAVARLAGTGDPPRAWWLVAVLAVGLAGLAVAVGAHRRGYRMAGFCAAPSPACWSRRSPGRTTGSGPFRCWWGSARRPGGAAPRPGRWPRPRRRRSSPTTRRSPGQAIRPTQRGWWPATCTCCSAWPCWGQSA